MTDELKKFVFDAAPVRGELVRLEGTWREVLRRRHYPAAVSTLLGEMMAAAFGDTRFFTVEANHFPQGTALYSTAGADKYNQRNPATAKDMAAKAGYNGQPVRILASRQYEFHYNMALVMAEQLKRAGMKPELQVVDWATLVQRRNDPKLWDIYITHSGQFPEPMLSPPQLSEGAPGWWSSPAKQSALTAFNQEMDPAKRGALWGKVQQVVYDEVPYINVGKFNSLSARAQRLGRLPAELLLLCWHARVLPCCSFQSLSALRCTEVHRHHSQGEYARYCFVKM